ncbi:GBF-interacting protein [Heracleum sosnowskyi]|uniref:GBF-interacting protein n=1 Tax=Heracleum sosnowskyi TaxID=360622 RepID=A0AAD8M499_9APIA|nr:GBF-interacting protein [Heracleum sosnowskyi]
MVFSSTSRIDGGPQILSAGVRKTIQSLKEIVGNHSDAEIYSTLKETNMDPNETVQKLLNQDPFHEVKRKRDKRREVTTNMVYTASQQKKHSEPLNQGTQHSAHSDHNIRSRGIIRNSLPDPKVSREFRVVRDNRTNHKTNSMIKPPMQSQISSNEPEVPKFADKSSLNITSNNQKQPVGRHSSKSANGITDPQPRQPRGVQINGEKESLVDNRASVKKAVTQVQTKNTNDSQLSTTSSNNSVAGVYSSSSDPVHVPSPDSRPAANIGAIKREVGAVGVRRLPTEISAKGSSTQSNSFPNSHLGRDGPSRDSFRSSASMSKSSHPTQTPVNESTVRSISVTKPFVNNQHVNRQHQSSGHQKVSSHSNKEWKPKSSQKQSTGPGVIGTPSKSASPPADASKNVEAESTQLPSRIDISDNQNVIIAPHIRVSTTDRFRVTFGSVGTEFEPSRNSGFEAVEGAEELAIDPSASVSVSTPESSGDESSGSKQEGLIDEHVRNSGTSSPASAAVSEQQLTGKKESSGPQDLDNADVGLVRDNSQSHTPSESQQNQDPPQLPIFSAYDPQTMYDNPYFRSAVDESARVQSQQLPQELQAISSHTVNSIPSSTVAMVQQPQLAQMYPQVHVSHYANIMPYRQFLSPVYVPPMAVPAGYSSNPAYPHPSNGNSYLLMPGPGGSSHLPAGGVKYGIQQFKPVPTGSPNGFGNFAGPNGYAINAPSGSATGLEDSSRMKYKDGNLYVPNPQAETSEIWMSQRDLPSMQSGSYYNMAGQTPHAAYLPSHTSHASFNAAAQSSHVQFPGMYHSPQPAGIPSPHHPSVGGNLGVGLAAGGPASQVNAFQQPQLGHMNWTGNF